MGGVYVETDGKDVTLLLSFSYTCVGCHWMMLYSQLGLRTPRSFTFCGTETVPVSFEYKESILDLMFIYCPSKNASILNLCEYLITILQLLEDMYYMNYKRLNAYIYSVQLHNCWTTFGTGNLLLISILKMKQSNVLQLDKKRSRLGQSLWRSMVNQWK